MIASSLHAESLLVFFNNHAHLNSIFCILSEPKYSASSGLELTLFKEEELIQKWQEILGQSNEVVVSVVYSCEFIRINVTNLSTSTTETLVYVINDS